MEVRRRPTIRMVAEQAEVSVATVSYVLSGRAGGNARVSDDTRARVVSAARDLGYQANQQARSVRRGRSDQVCLVLGRLDTPWAQALAQEVAAAVGPAGYTTVVLVGGAWSTYLQSGAADAALIDDIEDPQEAAGILKALAARGVSLVAHHPTLAADGFDVLRPDETPACGEAMEHLTTRHTRIACLRGSGTSAASEAVDPRFGAYLDGLSAAGLPFDPDLVRFTHTSRTQAYRMSLDLLANPDPPTAIFAHSDVAALGALDAAHRRGIAVPGDLEVVGSGNTPQAVESDPQLSSVGPDASFPRDAAQLLLRRLQGEEASDPAVLQVRWTFHRRGSTVG